MVKIDHAKETLERLCSRGLGVLLDGFYLACERTNTVFIHLVTKELDFGQAKLAFLHFDNQSVFLQTVKKNS